MDIYKEAVLGLEDRNYNLIPQIYLIYGDNLSWSFTATKFAIEHFLSVEKTSIKVRSEKKILFVVYSSFIASSRGTATNVSVATTSWKSNIAFMASFSVGASIIVTPS